MKDRHLLRPWMAFVIMLAGVGVAGGCDSGEKVVDEVTGNRAVKQYHKTKEDIRKIAEQQAEKYGRILGDDQETDD